jgi:ATP-dependent exoDNAse (exonuclease V) beta subunit
MSTLHIYRSAAGAGKTHVLVKAYLQLALQNPDSFRKILAVTFTNQATQEMKQRILTSLHSMAQGIDNPLASDLLQLNSWEPSTLQKRAQLALSHVLHHYDHFSISTIDSFLQTIVRNFSKELGIQHGFAIEMDPEAVLSQIITQVIHQAGEDLALRQWLVGFAEHKLLAGKSWHFKQALHQLGYELFTENFSLQEAELVQATSNPQILTSFVAELTKKQSLFEETLQQLGAQALHIIEAAGLSIADFAYGKQGVAGFLWGVYQKKNFTPSQRAYAAVERLEAWYSKSSPHRDAIIQVVQSKLQGLLQDIINIYEAQYTAYHTVEAVQQLIYAFGIITHLLASLRQYRTEKNVLLISDTAKLLRQIIADNETPFVYEKIGSFYNHFLIDEFQDISAFQWQNLKPLIQNSLAMGHMSLVVGDVKQSIYRWRGGQWQLLATQLEQEFKHTKNVVLDYNWRSKPHIIQFNNTFFTQASKRLLYYLQQEMSQLKDAHLQEQLNNQLQEVATVYAHVWQQMPPSKLEDPGYVEINWIADQVDGNQQQDWTEQVKRQLPALLEDLQDAGYKLQDIAILVRNHADGKELFQLLLDYQQSSVAKPGYNYTALSAASLELANSPWVNILISALHYIANPQDQLAKAELIYLYQVYVCKHGREVNHDFFYHSLLEDEDGLLPAAFTAAYTELSTLPLYEQVFKLVETLQLMSTLSRPFIEAFQDIVLTYIQTQGSDIQFLAWWHATKHKHVLPRIEGQDALSIMTIHQSKGLEFKVVIVPFCNWELDHNISQAPTLWCTTNVAPFDTFPSLPLRYHPRLADTIYAKDYYQERIQVHIDHLNLLYVAFTRAEDRLYIFTPHTSKAALHTTADLIYQTVRQSPVPSTTDKQAGLDWDMYWRDTENKLVIDNKLSNKAYDDK